MLGIFSEISFMISGKAHNVVKPNIQTFDFKDGRTGKLVAAIQIGANQDLIFYF